MAISTKEVAFVCLADEAEQIHRRGKACLIVDNEANGAQSFYSYGSCTLIPAKKFVTMKIKKTPEKEILEEMRTMLVGALKFGKPIVIAMEKSAPSFSVGNLCHPDYFPIEIFTNPNYIISDECINKIVRDTDKENGFFNLRDPKSFSVTLLTSFQVEDYVDFLKEQIPLSSLETLVINDKAPVFTCSVCKKSSGTADKLMQCTDPECLKYFHPQCVPAPIGPLTEVNKTGPPFLCNECLALSFEKKKEEEKAKKALTKTKDVEKDEGFISKEDMLKKEEKDKKKKKEDTLPPITSNSKTKATAPLAKSPAKKDGTTAKKDEKKGANPSNTPPSTTPSTTPRKTEAKPSVTSSPPITSPPKTSTVATTGGAKGSSPPKKTK